jgi:hypothetical protein
MLRVYCSWPGVSATMNLRRSVREEAVGHVDRDALLALGGQAVDQQREVESPPCVPTSSSRLERRELVLEQHLRFVQQAADQRALAVVDAAAGDEAQQALVLVLLAGRRGRCEVGDEVGNVCRGRRTLPGAD